MEKQPARRAEGRVLVRIRKDADIVALLKQVEACRGRVEFSTAEGDRLDLKSPLARYILAALSTRGGISDSGEVTCENEDDCEMLKMYLTAEQD